MIHSFLKYLFCFTLCWLPIIGQGQTSSVDDTNEEKSIEKIAALVDNYVQKNKIPAISIGIVQKGKTTFINRGNYDRGATSEEIDEHSTFQIASLSKTLTAIIINQLILENKIGLNEPITSYLPKDYSPKVVKKLSNITIRDLLHHYSGLPGDSKILRKKRKGNKAFNYEYTAADFEKDFKKMRLKAKVGTKHIYSNFGYAVLGFIAENVTGQSFDKLVKLYLADKYNLQQTTLDLSQTTNLVTPYDKNDIYKKTAPWIMGRLSPPSAFFSSTTDFTKLIKHQIAAYQKDENHPLILTKDVRPIVENVPVNYGYGMVLWGNGVFGGQGEMDGFGGDYSFQPKSQNGFIILTSCYGDWLGALAKEISQIIYK